jgi:hypothetical protein
MEVNLGFKIYGNMETIYFLKAQSQPFIKNGLFKALNNCYYSKKRKILRIATKDGTN